jgi:hypothetical protein
MGSFSFLNPKTGEVENTFPANHCGQVSEEYLRESGREAEWTRAQKRWRDGYTKREVVRP